MPLLLILLLLAPFTPYLDLTISDFFYSKNGAFYSNSYTYFMFHYAVLPAQVLSVVCIPFVFVKKWQKPALTFLLTVVIGSGLVVNVVFKDHWGRPRPKQTENFGGKYAFSPFYMPHIFEGRNSCKSFPCGHASMGFCFFALYFVGRRNQKDVLKKLGLVLGFGLGISLGITRIAMGGHYFSDVVMSGSMMWFVAYAIDNYLNREKTV